jgi:hypothetical protein
MNERLARDFPTVTTRGRAVPYTLVGLLLVLAACGSERQHFLLYGQPGGILTGHIVFAGRVPRQAFTDRYSVVVLQGQRQVGREGLGAHDTYRWLVCPERGVMAM